MKAPNQAGYWWSDGPDGRKLLVVAEVKGQRSKVRPSSDLCPLTSGFLVRLSDAIHGWPLWFKPDLRRWTNWICVDHE